jgi:hypothetical protein
MIKSKAWFACGVIWCFITGANIHMEYYGTAFFSGLLALVYMMSSTISIDKKEDKDEV